MTAPEPPSSHPARAAVAWPLRWAAIGMLAGALAGCSLLAPQVFVGDAQFVEASDEALRVDIQLDLMNLNNEPIELKQFDYTVSVDGRRIYSGRRAAQATLSALGEASVVLPAIVTYEAAGWTSAERPDTADWSINGSVLYLTPGALAEILLDTRFREPRAAFRGDGSVAIQ